MIADPLGGCGCPGPSDKLCDSGDTDCVNTCNDEKCLDPSGHCPPCAASSGCGCDDCDSVVIAGGWGMAGGEACLVVSGSQGRSFNSTTGVWSEWADGGTTSCHGTAWVEGAVAAPICWEMRPISSNTVGLPEAP